MKAESTHVKFLSNSLEKIIFDENDFNKLKQTINDLTLGLIEPKKLKEVIINSRFRLLEELLDFFSFQKAGEEFAKESEIPDPCSVKELKEKDELLQELGNRIDKIFNKLKDKQNE